MKDFTGLAYFYLLSGLSFICNLNRVFLGIKCSNDGTYVAGTIFGARGSDDSNAERNYDYGGEESSLRNLAFLYGRRKRGDESTAGGSKMVGVFGDQDAILLSGLGSLIPLSPPFMFPMRVRGPAKIRSLMKGT
ncbi:hypothetical protein QYF36_021609 [Acer negundo]|nr:hypothetical protein QYF36_021609 [Acer negundo]